MWIEFKEYQEEAIQNIKREALDLLDSGPAKRVCIFKSPTGSGKTLIVAESIRRLIEDADLEKDLSFIWVSVNKLHDQSREKLKRYYDQYGGQLKCSYFDDLNGRIISKNEILFLNWASINKNDNVFIRENERNNNLSNVVERTKAAGREVVLIIDESHETAKTEKSQQLIDDLSPKVIVEVSATPNLTDHSAFVRVDLEDVQREGMIKKEIVINQDFDKSVDDDKTADELVLRAALDKRSVIAGKYKEMDSGINPLMLIQVPNSVKGLQDKKDSVVAILEEYGVTKGNLKLASWLEGKDDKFNLENIEKNESDVEVMIFKQAIAVGWDCPRAALLVMFREMKSIVFSIQTVGRIMRMPEQHHYSDEALNVGYIYTSLSDFGIAEGVARDYITVNQSKLKDGLYDSLGLRSFHRKRFREQTRLSPKFTEVFLEVCDEMKLENRITLTERNISMDLISDGLISDVDSERDGIELKEIVKKVQTQVELQNGFDSFIRENLAPFYPEERSIMRVNKSIYKYFQIKHDIGADRWPEVQVLVLCAANRGQFVDVINRSKELYSKLVAKRESFVEEVEAPWDVPGIINVGIDAGSRIVKKSIMEPFYYGCLSSPETAFIDHLEDEKSCPNVKWWHKNGTSDMTSFAISYLEGGVAKLFYVDFIIRLNDGRIGLFDTKGGVFAKESKAKAESLYSYISVENEKGGNLFGGILVHHQGSWRYNNNKVYEYNPDDLSNWEFLDLK